MAKGTGGQSGGPGSGRGQRGRASTDADTVLGEKIGNQGGSNPGGVYRGTDGVERYVKFYSDPAQAHGEVLANSIYNDLGLSAPSSIAFEKDGHTAFASKMIKDSQGELGKVGLTEARAKRFMGGFAADVLTANWDAAGLTLDNVIERKGGTPR